MSQEVKCFLQLLLFVASLFYSPLKHRFSKSSKLIFQVVLLGGSTCLPKMGVWGWEDNRIHQWVNCNYKLVPCKEDKFYSHSRSLGPSSISVGFQQNPMLHNWLFFMHYPQSCRIFKCQSWKDLRVKLTQDLNYINEEKQPPKMFSNLPRVIKMVRHIDGRWSWPGNPFLAPRTMLFLVDYMSSPLP